MIGTTPMSQGTKPEQRSDLLNITCKQSSGADEGMGRVSIPVLSTYLVGQVPLPLTHQGQ